MISLKCDSPVRIRNQYNGQWMYVNCRKCPACLINKVNTNCVHLLEEVKQYPFSMMVTLTYDNENIPYMVRGSYDVYRGVPSRQFPKVVNRFDDLDLNKFESVKISGFPDGDMTSVINYKDFQKFFKRLRVYYERKLKRKFPYRYHCICEYGTFGKRAHGHILFFGNEEFDEPFRNAVIASWKLHDWTKLPMAEVFKFADAGVASYVTSYVNSLCGCDGFFSEKRIKSKCFRSKKIDFGVDKELFQAFQKGIQCGFRGQDFRGYENYLRRYDTKKLGRFSTCLLPRKIILAYFAAPSRICSTNFGDFFSLCTASYRRYSSERGKGYELENSDYRLRLAYGKYCNLRGLCCNLSSWMDFVCDSWLIRNEYASYVLQESMRQASEFKDGYKASLFNTKLDDLEKRDYWLFCNNVNYVDGVNCPDSFQELQTYKQNYKSKILPKHLKALVNGDNI